MTKVVLLTIVLLQAIGALGQVSDTSSTAIRVPVYWNAHLDKRDYACNGADGIVIVGVEVDSLCRITRKTIVTSLDENCDRAALRMVNDDFELSLMKANQFDCTPGSANVLIRFKNKE
jgi:hypothetical protein